MKLCKKCGETIQDWQSTCTKCKSDYAHKYYNKNKETLLTKLKDKRSRCEPEEQQKKRYYTKLDRRIQAIIGHMPTWWEREYFIE